MQNIFAPHPNPLPTSGEREWVVILNFIKALKTPTGSSLSPCGRVAETTCWRCGEGSIIIGLKPKKKFHKNNFLKKTIS